MANLYDCFERHLTNLEILEETDRDFVLTVVENYLFNLAGLGFNFSSHATDTFNELCFETDEMLKKKIYGHMSVDAYRSYLRSSTSADAA